MKNITALLVISVLISLAGCFENNSSYSVRYDPNGATGGSVPTAAENLNKGDSLYAARNTGKLVRTNYLFAGWNTAADGSGAYLFEGDPFTIGSSDITLYAQWGPAGIRFERRLCDDADVSAVTGCTSDIAQDITIPETHMSLPVPVIDTSAFWDCNSLARITIPDSIRYIESNAFHGCDNLTTVILPDSVKSVGSGAFSGCKSLTAINIPNRITIISSGMFEYCSSLASISIPANITEIYDHAFYNCSSLTEITIPSQVTFLGNGAFADCTSLTSITMKGYTPPSLNEGSYAFYNIAQGAEIHVPGSDAVTAYKTAPGWSEYASLIVSP